MSTNVSPAARAIAGLVLGVAVSAGVAAQDHGDAVRALEARRFNAMVRLDVDAVAACLAEDLTYTHSSGETENKRQFLETLRSGRVKYEQIEPTDVEVRVYGRTAVVTGNSSMHTRREGQPQAFRIRFVEVDVERDGRWQMVLWQATRLPQ